MTTNKERTPDSVHAMNLYPEWAKRAEYLSKDTSGLSEKELLAYNRELAELNDMVSNPDEYQDAGESANIDHSVTGSFGGNPFGGRNLEGHSNGVAESYARTLAAAYGGKVNNPNGANAEGEVYNPALEDTPFSPKIPKRPGFKDWANKGWKQEGNTVTKPLYQNDKFYSGFIGNIPDYQDGKAEPNRDTGGTHHNRTRDKEDSGDLPAGSAIFEIGGKF